MGLMRVRTAEAMRYQDQLNQSMTSHCKRYAVNNRARTVAVRLCNYRIGTMARRTLTSGSFEVVDEADEGEDSRGDEVPRRQPRLLGPGLFSGRRQRCVQPHGVESCAECCRGGLGAVMLHDDCLCDDCHIHLHTKAILNRKEDR